MMVFPVLSSEELNMESAPTEQLAIKGNLFSQAFTMNSNITERQKK